jgi:ATP-dependent RNA helicase SUPV3L1/SUV3
MWGEQAVGRLAPGDDPLKPRIVAFVDEEAGPDVAQKVERRLQHFIDRRIAAQFEPLLAMGRDEAITGLARGVAFRMTEAFGIVPRAEIADDIKALDQDARGMLRKHGVRFGQFTIFLPLLLKPAPTRLRLVLWGLWQGLDVFPESPPPGLVTIPHETDQPQGYYTMSGYRPAASRAIRIDMLERLADMLRGQDTRGGFEATADMLSITGLTLEQFADLMGGLGYRAERGERTKVKAPAPTPEPAATDAPETVDETVLAAAPPTGLEGADTPDPAPTELPVERPDETPPAPPAETPADQPDETPADTPTEVPDSTPDEASASEGAAPEMEVFYTFVWAPPRRKGGGGKGPRRAEGGKPRGQSSGKPGGKPGGKPRGKGGKPPRDDRPKTFSSRPEKKDRIDPDNPFAQALAGLKDKS